MDASSATVRLVPCSALQFNNRSDAACMMAVIGVVSSVMGAHEPDHSHQVYGTHVGTEAPAGASGGCAQFV